jgi:hypothetical protein
MNLDKINADPCEPRHGFGRLLRAINDPSIFIGLCVRSGEHRTCDDEAGPLKINCLAPLPRVHYDFRFSTHIAGAGYPGCQQKTEGA